MGYSLVRDQTEFQGIVSWFCYVYYVVALFIGLHTCFCFADNNIHVLQGFSTVLSANKAANRGGRQWQNAGKSKQDNQICFHHIPQQLVRERSKNGSENVKFCFFYLICQNDPRCISKGLCELSMVGFVSDIAFFLEL